MLLGQSAQPRRQEGHSEAVGRPDAHRAGHLLVAGHLGTRGDHVGLHALGHAEQPRAGRGELAARCQPPEQLGAQFLLERSDAARYGGMVQPQSPCCPQDLAGACDRQEDAQIVPVHAATLS